MNIAIDLKLVSFSFLLCKYKNWHKIINQCPRSIFLDVFKYLYSVLMSYPFDKVNLVWFKSASHFQFGRDIKGISCFDISAMPDAKTVELYYDVLSPYSWFGFEVKLVICAFLSFMHAEYSVILLSVYPNYCMMTITQRQLGQLNRWKIGTYLIYILSFQWCEVEQTLCRNSSLAKYKCQKCSSTA